MIFSNTCDPLFHFTTIQQYFSNLVDSSFVEHEEEVWTVGSMHVQKKKTTDRSRTVGQVKSIGVHDYDLIPLLDI